MGNFITSTSILAASGSNASGSASGFGHANVKLTTHPNRVWKASATGANTWVEITVGTAAVAVVVDNFNSTAITVTGATGFTGLAPDSADGRYKVYTAVTGSPTTIRVTNNSATTTDGTNVFSVGSIVALSAVNTWTINAEFPYEITPLWPVIANDDFSGGGREPVLVGNKYCRISMTQSNFPTAVGATDVWQEINGIAALGQHQPFVFYRNSGDTSQVYVCRRIGDCTMSLNGPGHFGVRGLVLEECV